MPPTIKEIEERAESLTRELDRAIEDTQGILAKTIESLEARILVAFKELKTTPAGTLIGPKVNLKQAQEIHKQLIKHFEDSYKEGVKSLNGFDKVARAIQNNWLDVDNAIEFTGIDKQMMRTLKNQKVAEFIEFGNAARERIAGAMYDHVVGHAPYSELVDEMRSVLGTGLDKRGNNMARYADLWSNDSIMNFHQAVSTDKGNSADLRSYLYYGNIMKTSRPFCIDRAGKVFSRHKINSWNDMSWKGKRGPAMVYRGGWNCRHHWMPVNPEWIEDGEIERQDYFDEEGIEIARGTTLPDKQKSGTRPKK